MKVTVVCGLIALYTATILCALRPRVSAEYRAYYMDQVLSDWKPSRYVATPEEGVRFDAPGLPSFVRNMYGFSRRESWGRWTDANHSPRAEDGTPVARVVLNEALEGPICLNVRARAADWTLGRTITVALGRESHALVLDRSGFSDGFVEFEGLKPEDTIEFKPSGIVGSNSTLGVDLADDQQHPHSASDRRRALVLASLRLFHGRCADVKSPLRMQRASSETK